MSHTTTTTFTLSRAFAEDIPEITRLQYTCVSTRVRELYMGCRDVGNLPLMIAKQVHALESDPCDIWVKVCDAATGGIVAASNWKLFLNGPGPRSSDTTPPAWLEGEEAETAARLMGELNDARRKAIPGPHLFLQLCFTDPNYQRRGAAAMMVRWGCALADQLFLPAWLKASAQGHQLYANFGFRDDVDESALTAEERAGGFPMTRGARTDGIVGGRGCGGGGQVSS